MNYYQIWKTFNQFFIQLDVKPRNWEDRLTLFIAYLLNKRRQSSTIKSYISAIKAVLLNNKIKIKEDKYLLSSLIRAYRLKNDQIKTRLPIGRDLLYAILQSVWNTHINANQIYLAHLYTTILITMFYGMFRIWELTFGPHTVLADNVHIGTNKSKLLFMLWTSKTHSRGSRPQKIKISQNPAKTAKGNISVKWCPFQMLSRYLEIRWSRSSGNPTEQFFIFKDRSPVKPCHLRKILKEALTNIKLNYKLYSVHSLRAGRAIQLLKMGIPVDTIKILGCWKSNTIYKYLK